MKTLFTNEIRLIAQEEKWESRFGAHTRQAWPDPRDTSSLMVVGFDSGLSEDCTPDEFVRVVLPIIDATTPLIDEIVTDDVAG
ncbi:MAG: hypothetical protein J0L78_11960 [Planctomycetes bacterium]|nr:hypothetical protein [Planctomycetota bacterium]